MKKFIKKRFGWIIFFFMLIIMLVVGLLPKNKTYDESKYIFDFDYNNIKSVELGISINEESKYEYQKIQSSDNGWNLSKKYKDKMKKSILNNIVDMEYVKSYNNYDEKVYEKYQLNKPNYIIKINLVNSESIIMKIGNNIIEEGYYFVHLKDSKNDIIYLIPEHYVNLIRSGFDRVFESSF